MHPDHIFGLPGFLCQAGAKQAKEREDTVPPLLIYGPYGLYEFIITCLRLSESTIRRKIVVHEMIISDDDARVLQDRNGRSPWRKPAAAFRPNGWVKEKISAIRLENETAGVNGNETIFDKNEVDVGDEVLDMEETEGDRSVVNQEHRRKHVTRVELTSHEGMWTCVDDEKVNISN